MRERFRLITPIVCASLLLCGRTFAADKVPAAGGDIEITPLLHASVQIAHAGTVIQVDPWSQADLSRAQTSGSDPHH